MKYDSLVDSLHVICFICALARNGLNTCNTEHLETFTESVALGPKFGAGPITYYYNPNIDYEYEVTPMPTNPLLLLPSRERAIVESIKYLDFVDEGVLIESIKTYLDVFWDDCIYTVGEHFQVDRATLDYWFQEAREDQEI